jgi:AcrR family transcriptional regulator
MIALGGARTIRQIEGAASDRSATLPGSALLLYLRNSFQLHFRGSSMAVPAHSKTVRPQRRSQEERRRDTQNAILNAALEVLIEEGYEGFTTTRVAQTAGVSRGAQENYFRTKDELILAATRHALSQAAEHAQTLASSAVRSDEPVAKFLADSQSFFFSRKYLALLEIIVIARHRPMLARTNTPVVRKFREHLNAIWIDALCEAGYERKSAETFIKMTHYLLRGMALTSLWQPQTAEYRALLADWRHIGVSQLKLVRKA